MSYSPRAPQTLQGGLVTVDPPSGRVLRVISLQYNPDSVKRTLQPQWYEAKAGAGVADRLRVKGPPVETLNLDAELDAADYLDSDQNDGFAAAQEHGLHPQLAALETLLYPTADQLEFGNTLQAAGTLEIVPMEAPLTVFVWSKARVTPVRITDFSVTEQFFDTQLNPIRAQITLGMKVLSVVDLGFAHRGGSLFMQYLRQKETLSALARGGTLKGMGLRGL